jgi:tetratricopeptide (TPR) repeat protein
MRAAVSEKKTGAAAAYARKAGQIFLAFLKQPEKARPAFQLALSLDPSDAAANAGLKGANGQVAEEYYRRGFIAFQRQNLDGAIAAWNIVLSINPNYRDAQLNRDEAIQLKANLLKLKG